jgi:D-amino-acid dehydrogenase
MRVLVLGGGIAGVTAAYYLAKDGQEVTLVEAQEGVGRDASGANAGMIAPGHSFAWASPKAPGMLLRSLLGQETAIRVRPRLDPALVAWGARFLRECTEARARRNTLVKLRLCQYSQALMTELVGAEGIEYHAVTRGALYIYRDPREFERGVRKMAMLAEHGQRQEVLDPAQVARLEPAFAPVQEKIAGAVRDLGDTSGDSRLFTERLARLCQEKLGVTLRLGTCVTGLQAQGDRIVGALTASGRLTADAYVLALGVATPLVARTVGVRLGIYPAKGYSSTFPLRTDGLAPTMPGVDEQWLVGWSRQGDRLRLTSTAEFAGHDRSWTARDFNNILRLARDLFPTAADWERGDFRACLRPMTPDGPPVLGAGRHRNLYFDAGHGHMGWTMGFATGRIVADLVAGRKPDHDLTGLLPRPVVGGL